MAAIDAGTMLDTVNNVTKLAANLSEKKEPTHITHSTDDSNRASAGNQTVQIALDGGKKKEPKPVEKHIHTFPEGRALTTEECDLAWKKAQLEADIQRQQMAYVQRCDDREWEHRMQLEKKEQRKRRVAGVIAGVCAALGIGCAGYGIYADYRDRKNAAANPTAAEPVKVEATVK